MLAIPPSDGNCLRSCRDLAVANLSKAGAAVALDGAVALRFLVLGADSRCSGFGGLLGMLIPRHAHQIN
jgi:hypothetical protein